MVLNWMSHSVFDQFAIECGAPHSSSSAIFNASNTSNTLVYDQTPAK